MGRILRKKASPKVKKRKASDAGVVIQAKSETATEQPAAGEKEAPRKPAASQRKPLPAAKPASSGATRNFVEKAMQFLREVKVELKKVTWPSRKQTLGSTVVVIILVMIISLFLGVVDVSLSSLIRLAFNH